MESAKEYNLILIIIESVKLKHTFTYSGNT
jgi:hypothetical protein